MPNFRPCPPFLPLAVLIAMAGAWSPGTIPADDADPVSYYPEAAAPDRLQVIDRGDMGLDEYLMMLSLQGVLAQEKPQIYITGHDPAYRFWLDEMKESYGVRTVRRTDPLLVLNEFKHRVSGYILCAIGTPSVNTATSMAGIRKAVVVPEALEDRVKALGLEMVLDARVMEPGRVFEDHRDAFDNGRIFTLDHGFFELRDFVIASKGLIYHESADFGGDFFNEDAVYGWVREDAPHIGWGGVNKPDEVDFVGDATRHGLFTVPANHTVNLSTLSALKKDKLEQKSFATGEAPEEEVHHLAFLMSDGDNVSFVLHGLASDPKYFANAHRGEFPMNWTMATTLIDLAPAALEWYYENAREDYFVAGGSGNGYMYPSRYPDLVTHARRLNDYVGRNDMPYVGVLDWPVIGDADFHRVASIYARQSNVKGGFYVNYQGYALGNGAIRFVDGKPFVALRENLWEGDPVALARKVNGHSRNPADPGSYTIMNVHAWSHDMDDIATVVANLDPHVKVVNLDELFQQIERNVDPAPLTMPDRNFAVLHDSHLGTQEEGGVLAFINSGDYALYRDIDFGGPGIKTMTVRASSAAGGGRIEVRLDGPGGKLLGTLEIGHTGGWQEFREFSGEIGEFEGRGDLYFGFEGDDGYLFNLDWFAIETRPLVESSTRPALRLRFFGAAGKNHLISSTPDLESWWSETALLEGRGEYVDHYVPINTGGRKLFRVLAE